MTRAALAVAACAALLAGCAQPLLHAGHPLDGRIWDPRADAFVSADVVWRRAAATRHVLVGEVHDNPVHHRLQREALERLAALGPRRALAMEQFDSEHQAELEAALQRHADAESLADAGRLDRRGWEWPHYRPLVEFALERGWPVIAANLSRAAARRVVADPGLARHLPPPDPAVVAALERDMVDGHCGHRVEGKLLAGMVNAQRARDARMAEVMERMPGAQTVLIAGNGHVRRDRGVPLYLGGGDVLAIGQLEVLPSQDRPADYFAGGFATLRSYDYVWFTPRVDRVDPCAGFRMPANR